MSDDKVVDLEVETTLPIPANKVLEAAIDEIDDAVVIGWDKRGELYVASSSNAPYTVWMLEKAKRLLLEES